MKLMWIFTAICIIGSVIVVAEDPTSPATEIQVLQVKIATLEGEVQGLRDQVTVAKTAALDMSLAGDVLRDGLYSELASAEKIIQFERVRLKDRETFRAALEFIDTALTIIPSDEPDETFVLALEEWKTWATQQTVQDINMTSIMSKLGNMWSAHSALKDSLGAAVGGVSVGVMPSDSLDKASWLSGIVSNQIGMLAGALNEVEIASDATVERKNTANTLLQTVYSQILGTSLSKLRGGFVVLSSKIRR